MIGNDVIDLQLAAREDSWRRKGFLSKLFTCKEVNLIMNSNDPFETVWLLWSMKESAYKVFIRQTNIRFFAPKSFSCHLETRCKGRVCFEGHYYKTWSKIAKDFIYTEAIDEPRKFEEGSYRKIFIGPFDSDTLKANLILAFARKSHLPLEQLQLIKNAAGVPSIYHFEKKLETTCSLTHHGNYGAYAISLAS